MAVIDGFEYRPECRHFSGYRPCRFKRLCADCPHYAPCGKRILLINLDAMGDVLMTTAMLKPLRRKYGEDAHVTWVTRENAAPLLRYNPLVDRVVVYDPEACMVLAREKFDAAFNCDKAAHSCALLDMVKADEKYGFILSPYGTIVPCNPENAYNFEMGLNDRLKFKENTLPGTRILHEGMGLSFARDEYILVQSEEEKDFTARYREIHGLAGRPVIGINTGCADLYPHKKLHVSQYVWLCRRLREEFPEAAVILVGGTSETERNKEISRAVPGVLATPTTMGLRRGIGFIDLCDVLVTGDTLALHIGVALKKFVVAFFTVSCAQEIDLYDRGVKVTSPLPCSPCWKRDCPDPRCIREFPLERLVDGVRAYFREAP